MNPRVLLSLLLIGLLAGGAFFLFGTDPAVAEPGTSAVDPGGPTVPVNDQVSVDNDGKDPTTKRERDSSEASTSLAATRAMRSASRLIS